MKFRTLIHNSKLQNEIKNQSVATQAYICLICNAVNKLQNKPS